MPRRARGPPTSLTLAPTRTLTYRGSGILLVIGCAAQPIASSPAPLDGYAEQMLALHPVGYWRLEGDLLDASPGANHGAFHSDPRLGDPGFDGEGVHFTGAAQYGEIPSRPEYSLNRAWDDFDRSDLRSWGGAWHGGGSVATLNGVAVMRGDGEQDLPLWLARGNVQVRAAWTGTIALVAERVDDRNFVRAELRDDSGVELRVVATVDGVDTELAAMAVGAPGGYDLRLELDGTALRARAWPVGTDQPTTWLAATAPVAATGEIGIRHTGGELAVQTFRTQTLGLSVHAAVRVDPDPPLLEHILGKGDHSGFTSGTDQEFHVRFDNGRLKAYAFNRDGGFGAGEGFAADADRWYDLVVEYQPGDFRDLEAGVRLFVDGTELATGPGARYRSSPCTATAHTCWSIDPRASDAPLRIGTSDGETFFAGDIDELAIFDRLLTPEEITSLRR